MANEITKPSRQEKKPWWVPGMLLVTGGLSAVVAIAALTTSDRAEAHPGWKVRGDGHAAGDPLPSLSDELFTLFDVGREVFEHEFTPSEGLGPIYNERACQTCHGGLGGPPGGPDPDGVGSIFNVTHFGFDNHGQFDPLRELGGPVIQHRNIQEFVPACTMAGETLPSEADVLSIRHTPAVWGFGLIDAIPDAEILRRENLGVDGVRGVANWGREMQARAAGPTAADPQLHVRGMVRVGRFGWKAQTATLAQFSSEPFGIELGVTNPFFPQVFTPEGLRFDDELPAECQVAPIPNDEDNSAAFASYHFQALLAPPPRRPLGIWARVGEILFNKIGCATCHTPALHTGPEYWLVVDEEHSMRVPQLENKDVQLYSDLLTHDMGDLLADNEGTTVGRVMGRADGRRWRTTPLWGLRFKEALLHDGRTADVREAVLLHGGEARASRKRFARLPRLLQQAILEFLNRI